MKTLAEQIKELRLLSGLTQKDFAKKLAVSQCMISLWESGTHIPSMENIKKLATFADVPIEEFLESKTNVSNGFNGNLKHLIDDLSPRQKECLAAFLESLTDKF